MKKLNVVTLCDGISCGQLSLTAAQIPYKYLAVEPDEKCKALVRARFPETIQRDYVEDVTGESLCRDLGGSVDVLMISAPCQDISVQGKGRGMATVDGYHIYDYEDYLYFKNRGYSFTRSATFWECVRVHRELLAINPNLIVINENVVNSEWQPIMVKALIGTIATVINSSNFLPQNRNRCYLTNFPIDEIAPANLKLGDIIPGANTGAGWHGSWDKDQKKWIQKCSLKEGNMAKCITTWVGTEGRPGTKFYVDNNKYIFPFTIEQLEQLQGLPIQYTALPGLNDKDRHKMIGNCWTIPVIVHILKSFVKRNQFVFYEV